MDLTAQLQSLQYLQSQSKSIQALYQKATERHKSLVQHTNRESLAQSSNDDEFDSVRNYKSGHTTNVESFGSNAHKTEGVVPPLLQLSLDELRRNVESALSMIPVPTVPEVSESEIGDNAIHGETDVADDKENIHESKHEVDAELKEPLQSFSHADGPVVQHKDVRIPKIPQNRGVLSSKQPSQPTIRPMSYRASTPKPQAPPEVLFDRSQMVPSEEGDREERMQHSSLHDDIVNLTEPDFGNSIQHAAQRQSTMSFPVTQHPIQQLDLTNLQNILTTLTNLHTTLLTHQSTHQSALLDSLNKVSENVIRNLGTLSETHVKGLEKLKEGVERLEKMRIGEDKKKSDDADAQHENISESVPKDNVKETQVTHDANGNVSDNGGSTVVDNAQDQQQNLTDPGMIEKPRQSENAKPRPQSQHPKSRTTKVRVKKYQLPSAATTPSTVPSTPTSTSSTPSTKTNVKTELQTITQTLQTLMSEVNVLKSSRQNAEDLKHAGEKAPSNTVMDRIAAEQRLKAEQKMKELSVLMSDIERNMIWSPLDVVLGEKDKPIKTGIQIKKGKVIEVEDSSESEFRSADDKECSDGVRFASEDKVKLEFDAQRRKRIRHLLGSSVDYVKLRKRVDELKKSIDDAETEGTVPKWVETTILPTKPGSSELEAMLDPKRIQLMLDTCIDRAVQDAKTPRPKPIDVPPSSQSLVSSFLKPLPSSKEKLTIRTSPTRRDPKARLESQQRLSPTRSIARSPDRSIASSPTRTARSPSRQSPDRRLPSPPNFYNVRLSNKPIFLRRTGIKPPTLKRLVPEEPVYEKETKPKVSKKTPKKESKPPKAPKEEFKTPMSSMSEIDLDVLRDEGPRKTKKVELDASVQTAPVSETVGIQTRYSPPPKQEPRPNLLKDLMKAMKPSPKKEILNRSMEVQTLPETREGGTQVSPDSSILRDYLKGLKANSTSDVEMQVQTEKIRDTIAIQTEPEVIHRVQEEEGRTDSKSVGTTMQEPQIGPQKQMLAAKMNDWVKNQLFARLLGTQPPPQNEKEPESSVPPAGKTHYDVSTSPPPIEAPTQTEPAPRPPTPEVEQPLEPVAVAVQVSTSPIIKSTSTQVSPTQFALLAETAALASALDSWLHGLMHAVVQGELWTVVSDAKREKAMEDEERKRIYEWESKVKALDELLAKGHKKKSKKRSEKVCEQEAPVEWSVADVAVGNDDVVAPKEIMVQTVDTEVGSKVVQTSPFVVAQPLPSEPQFIAAPVVSVEAPAPAPKPVPPPAAPRHETPPSSTVLSATLSEGEVITDLFSEGEVISGFDSIDLQRMIKSSVTAPKQQTQRPQKESDLVSTDTSSVTPQPSQRDTTVSSGLVVSSANVTDTTSLLSAGELEVSSNSDAMDVLSIMVDLERGVSKRSRKKKQDAGNALKEGDVAVNTNVVQDNTNSLESTQAQERVLPVDLGETLVSTRLSSIEAMGSIAGAESTKNISMNMSLHEAQMESVEDLESETKAPRTYDVLKSLSSFSEEGKKQDHSFLDLTRDGKGEPREDETRDILSHLSRASIGEVRLIGDHSTVSMGVDDGHDEEEEKEGTEVLENDMPKRISQVVIEPKITNINVESRPELVHGQEVANTHEILEALSVSLTNSVSKNEHSDSLDISLSVSSGEHQLDTGGAQRTTKVDNSDAVEDIETVEI